MDTIVKCGVCEPNLVVFSDQDGIQQMIVSAENKIIYELETTKLVDGFIALMCMYYVFDVSYPKFGRPTFFFFQDVLMQSPDQTPRPTRYSTYISNHLSVF